MQRDFVRPLARRFAEFDEGQWRALIDGKWVLVPPRAVLKQLAPDKYEVTEKIETPKGSKTSYFDAETGRFFLGVPRSAATKAPEVRVYQIKQ